MTWIYLRYRARMMWAALRPETGKDWGARIFIGVLILVNLPILVMMYWGMFSLFGTVKERISLEALQLLLHLPVTAFGIIFLILILGRIFPVLVESTDHDLLRSLPIPGPALTRLRLTYLSVIMSPLLLLFAPIPVFYGIHAGAGTIAYPAIVVSLLLFGLAAMGCGALVTTALAVPFSRRAMRWVSRSATLLVLIPLTIAMMAAAPMIRRAMEAIDQVQAMAAGLAVGPAAWLVDAIIAATAGIWSAWLLSSALLLLLAAVGWGGTWSLAERLLYADPETEAPTAAPVSVGGFGWWAPAWLGHGSRALWRREMTAVLAEAPRTMLLPVGMMAFFAIMYRFGLSGMPLHYLVGLFAVSVVSGLTMAAIGQEERAFWIIRSLPLPMWQVLLVKLVLRTGVSILVLAMMLGVAIAATPGGGDSVFNLPVDDALIPLLVPMVVLALILSAVWGLGIGARFPVFIPPRKGRYVTGGTSAIGSLGAMALVASMILSLLPLQVEGLRPLLWFLPLAVTAFWLAVCTMLVAWAAWHLERLEL